MLLPLANRRMGKRERRPLAGFGVDPDVAAVTVDDDRRSRADRVARLRVRPGRYRRVVDGAVLSADALPEAEYLASRLRLEDRRELGFERFRDARRHIVQQPLYVVRLECRPTDVGDDLLLANPAGAVRV